MTPSIRTNAADHYEGLNLEAFRRRRGGVSENTPGGVTLAGNPQESDPAPAPALSAIAEDVLACAALVAFGVLLMGALNLFLGWWR